MKPICEFIIIVGGPATGKTLNKEALMRHFNCEVCYDEALELNAPYHAGSDVKRVMILTYDADVEDPRVPRLRRKRGPRLEGTRVSIEAAKAALGDQWIEPDPHHKHTWRPPGEGRVLTCVYCGHEYPQDTPAAGHDILTAHIRVCEKHPMRKLEADNTKLRSALVGLVGAETHEELAAMEASIRVLPVPDEDRGCTINAIRALRETITG